MKMNNTIIPYFGVNSLEEMLPFVRKVECYNISNDNIKMFPVKLYNCDHSGEYYFVSAVRVELKKNDYDTGYILGIRANTPEEAEHGAFEFVDMILN